MDPRSGQKPMPAHARRSGLEALRAVLRAENPGFDFVFEIEGSDDDRKQAELPEETADE
jgi:hypothetical protein